MRDTAEVPANIPVYWMKFASKLARAGELNVAMTLVGRYEATDGAAPRAETLTVDGCAAATHVIAAIAVGAYDFFKVPAAEVSGGASVGAMSAQGESVAKRATLNRDGDDASCAKASSKDREPPENCGGLIRLEAIPLAGESASSQMNRNERFAWSLCRLRNPSQRTPARVVRTF